MNSNKNKKNTVKVVQKLGDLSAASAKKDYHNLSLDTPTLYNKDKNNNKNLIVTGNDRGYNILWREKTSIPVWRQSMYSAEGLVPTYYRLIALFRELELDATVTSLTNIRYNNVTSRLFVIKKDGVEDEALTNWFKKDWFYTFLRETVASVMWGYTLFQIGNIVDSDDEFGSAIESMIVHKREYYNPKHCEYLQSFTDLRGRNIYEDEELKNWFFDVTPYSFLNDFEGLYCRIALYQIYLKNTLFDFSDYLNRYGSGQMVLKTDMSDSDNIRQVENYLKTFRNSTYAMIGKDDELAVVEGAGKGSDTFLPFIKEQQSAMSKIILGSDTTPGSEKSFVGSAKISAQLSNMVSDNDIRFVETMFAEKLVKNLAALGLDFLDGNITLELDKMDKLDKEVEFDFITKLLGTGEFDIDPSYINERFGIPVTKRNIVPVDTVNTNTDVSA